MRLNCDYTDLDSLFEQYQKKVPDCEKLTRNEVKRFEAIFHKLAEVSNGGWISVKDRLPEGRTNPHTLDFEPVLCATVFGDIRVYKYGQRLGQTEAHFYHGYSWMDDYVTHWMPLPEPPKEGE